MARQWERHVVEVDTGLPPDAPADATPRPQFDPRPRIVRQIEAHFRQHNIASGQFNHYCRRTLGRAQPRTGERAQLVMR